MRTLATLLSSLGKDRYGTSHGGGYSFDEAIQFSTFELGDIKISSSRACRMLLCMSRRVEMSAL